MVLLSKRKIKASKKTQSRERVTENVIDTLKKNLSVSMHFYQQQKKNDDI